MATAVETKKLLTVDDLLAMPDDGVERELIRGELRESAATFRYPRHSATEARMAHVLQNWLAEQAKPRGNVFAGEVCVRRRRGPDTVVGIDLAYVSADVVTQTPDRAFYIDGPPRLAVEILCPSETYGYITEKVREYLATGVRLIWLLDPEFKTVCVHRPGAEPVLFNRTHELSGEEVLEGFHVPVAEIFES